MTSFKDPDNPATVRSLFVQQTDAGLTSIESKLAQITNLLRQAQQQQQHNEFLNTVVAPYVLPFLASPTNRKDFLPRLPYPIQKDKRLPYPIFKDSLAYVTFSKDVPLNIDLIFNYHLTPEPPPVNLRFFNRTNFILPPSIFQILSSPSYYPDMNRLWSMSSSNPYTLPHQVMRSALPLSEGLLVWIEISPLH